MEETTQPDSTGTPDMVLGKYKEMVLGKQLDIKKKTQKCTFQHAEHTGDAATLVGFNMDTNTDGPSASAWTRNYEP